MSRSPSLVPPGFAVPIPPDTADFVFEILGPEHNASDLAAWTLSIAHIHATPGFAPDGWPERVYSLQENLADLSRHRRHHLRGQDFAWTVLDPAGGRGTQGQVIGCAYLRPSPDAQADAQVRTWVVAERAHLDPALRVHVGRWVRASWPFRQVHIPGS